MTHVPIYRRPLDLALVLFFCEFVARGLATEAQRPVHTEVVVATPPDQATWAPP